MKNTIKSFLIVFVIAIAAFISFSTRASAWTDISWATGEENRIVYAITDFRNGGNGNLYIAGWAYHYRFQNYSLGNHDYWIMVVGSDGSTRVYGAEKFQQGLDLTNLVHINGPYGTCGETQDIAGNVLCQRQINGAGFRANIPLTDLEGDVIYTLYLRIAEYSGYRREFQTVINAPYMSLPQVEARHNLFTASNAWDSSRVYIGSDGVKVRRGPSKGAGDFKKCDSPFHCGSDVTSNNTYWQPMWYNHVYSYSLNGEGMWWNLGFNAPGAYGWPYGAKAELATDGTQDRGWITASFAGIYGDGIKLKAVKKSYVSNISIETKTAKTGHNYKATVKTNITNSNDSAGGGNPTNVKIEVGGREVFNNGTETWTGVKTYSIDIDPTETNREVKVTIDEVTNHKVTTMATTLYAASKQINTLSDVSGTVRGNNPIYVIKNSSSETKYYETITYNQGSTYYALDDDNILKKTATVTYSTNYSPITTWTQNDIKATSYVSSPQETYDMDATVRNGTKVTFAKNKTIRYTDLSRKNTQTTITGLGVNDITLKLDAIYQFIDAAEITVIDTRTHDKDANGEVYVTIHTDKNRRIYYKIFYGNQLLKEATETWNGDKKITLDDFIVTDKGNIRVEIVQPNTIPENLTGEIYVATEDEINLKQDGTYTPNTPIRVVKTPNSIKRYYETFKITSKTHDPVVPAGGCFGNDIRLDYTTTENTIGLNNPDITSQTYYPQQDDGLSYPKQEDGTFLVKNETTSGGSYSTTLPQYVLDRLTGAVYEKGNEPEGSDVVTGGRCWYVPMDSDEGNYDYETYMDKVGVNKVRIHIDNKYTVEGSLLGNTNSNYKVIRVKNPDNPNFTWHKTYSMSELVSTFKN